MTNQAENPHVLFFFFKESGTGLPCIPASRIKKQKKRKSTTD